MVLNPDTGSITPQFHVVFDDWFATVGTSASALPDFNSPQWRQLFGDSDFQYPIDEPDDSSSSPRPATRSVSQAFDRYAPPVPLPVLPPICSPTAPPLPQQQRESSVPQRETMSHPATSTLHQTHQREELPPTPPNSTDVSPPTSSCSVSPSTSSGSRVISVDLPSVPEHQVSSPAPKPIPPSPTPPSPVFRPSTVQTPVSIPS